MADKDLQRLLSAASDTNYRFSALCRILKQLDFDERVRGSHHIFSREGIEEILNLQSGADGKAKPYQVKQVREVITKYRLVQSEDHS